MKILTEVNKAPLFIGTTHPIGLDSRVAELVEVLKVEAQNDVKMVGIHGMGGIGKTTLARAVYNQIFLHFDACSFISNVREAAKQSSGLVSCQEQLLCDVFKDNKVKVNDIIHGIGIIKQRIKSKKVLLVLDDVDSKLQVDALAGSKDWFCSGSRIIITTINKLVLIGPLRVENVYELKVLDDIQSLQLFSWHAFGKEEPEAEIAELSKEVAATAVGLPLALEIFGRHFFGLETNKQREDMLKKLKKDIHERLKISFDALDKEEKIVFLDIACFFIGQQRSFATFLWKERGLFPTLTIKVLTHKCLVNINEHTRVFEMLDHIRDMGRKIVEDESPNPENRSRLWQKDDILKVLREKKGTEKIEAINLSCEHHSTTFVNTKCFAGMSQLKMLQLWNVSLEGEYRDFPKTLRWLSWNSKYLHCLPDELSLENIVVLDLSWSYNMHQVWRQEGSGSTKIFSQLKVLSLRECTRLTICPDFTGMPHLVELYFEGCVALTELHPSIWLLTSLQVLDLTRCSLITALPSQPSDSKSLKQPLLGRLKVLYFSFCNLPSQPSDSKSLKQPLLGQLKALYFSFCEELTICPDFTGMPHIEELHFEDCDSLTELHPSIWRLTSLKVLDLSGCYQMTALPSQPSDSKQPLLGRLKVLNLSFCEGLTTCPDFPCMPYIEELDFDYCANMTELHSSIGGLQSLTHLNLRGCGSLNELPKSIGHLKNLSHLNLGGCGSLNELPQGVWQLTSLKDLDLRYCCKVATLPSQLGNSGQLKWLFLDGTIITALPESMRHLKQLNHLSLNQCYLLKELPSSIHSLTQLTELSVIGCERLKFLPQLPCSLVRVDAAGCYEMEVIADVSKAFDLWELDLSGCQKLVDVPGVEQLRCLKMLKLGGCRSLSNTFKKRVEEADFPYLEELTIPGSMEES